MNVRNLWKRINEEVFNGGDYELVSVVLQWQEWEELSLTEYGETQVDGVMLYVLKFRKYED